MVRGDDREQTDRIMFTGRARHTDRSAGALARRRRVDEAFRRYLDWRRQSSTCESAYRQWMTSAGARESAIAFAAYTAAVDREERAAARYQAALCG
jgi:mevalonate pyrophosphate decarboxylase